MFKQRKILNVITVNGIRGDHQVQFTICNLLSELKRKPT
jgi:hypothetical protein